MKTHPLSISLASQFTVYVRILLVRVKQWKTDFSEVLILAEKKKKSTHTGIP